MTKLHRCVAVHDGLTYIVELKFDFRDGKVVVTVNQVIRVSPFNLQQEIE